MRRIFLLGGHDLEMLTIRELLIEKNELFFDAGLQWNNAVLSSYREVLNNEDAFWGVELRRDCDIPVYYHRIDHHNECPPIPSSLEQVASLLNVQLTHWQQLVAANDYGYIPAMLKLGATKEEISQVRLADRRAQGVSEYDELQAQEAIGKNLLKIRGLTIVQSQASNFSPICDKLFPYGELLVYSDSELVYYGRKSREVAAIFNGETLSGKTFLGGGEEGFFGFAKGFFTKEEIKCYVEQIKTIV